MAYLDLDSSYTTPVTDRTTVVPSEAETSFSPLEWSVIALARRDSPRSLGEPSRLSRALGSLFGLGTSSRLADPRLEALRRIAVLVWRRGYAVPAMEIRRFVAAGFQEAQLETLVTRITGWRVGERRARLA